jgi:Ni,Fe-hydrogenase maturation factor
MLDAKNLQPKMVPNYFVLPMEDDVYVIIMDAKTMHNQEGFVFHTDRKRRDALLMVARGNHRIRMGCARDMVGQYYAPSKAAVTKCIRGKCV